MKLKKNVQLLIIDPQQDFCNPKGNLFVQGADQDMLRLATFVNKFSKSLSDINITLDSHHMVDCAHPVFWRNSKNENPNPFTLISAKDVRDGVWVPTLPVLKKRMLDYVEKLEASQRYPLCIWPYHCIIGSWGQTIVPELLEAVNKWAVDKFATIEFVTKGSNPYTEHYSAVKAEVPDPSDPATQINTALIQKLEQADEILIAGEAGSHCLANTVRDIADNFSDQSAISKLVLLEDATSPVRGAIDFSKVQADFITEMKARGMRVTTTKDY